MMRYGPRVFGMARYFWEALREFNPADVKEDLERPFLVGIFGRENSGRATLCRSLFGCVPEDGTPRELVLGDVGAGSVAAVGQTNLAFLMLDASNPDWSDERRTAQEIAARGMPLFLVVTHADLLPSPDQAMVAVRTHFPDHPAELTAVVDPRDGLATRLLLVAPILKTVPGLRLTLANRFPPLRRAVAEELVRETSRINGQFALVSSVPSVIPVLGGMVSGMADMIVLTKNQALLVFKLAGIYGRDLDDRVGLLRELAPVIGGGFIWRSLARTAVGFLPPIASAVPKFAIAYAGTYAVGEAARLYYERGRPPTKTELKAIQDQAMSGARSYATSAPR
jgi:uncharacterized protein (DUF697 family)